MVLSRSTESKGRNRVDVVLQIKKKKKQTMDKIVLFRYCETFSVVLVQ